MTCELLVVGGGIAGLSAAVAARRAGWEARVFEQASAFSEVGAGLQLGPNATRILREWNLLEPVEALACRPQALRVRSAASGRELGHLRLGADAQARYGAPYLTVHRADLHRVLEQAADAGGARLHTGSAVVALSAAHDGVHARTAAGLAVEADAVAIADGVWSRLRAQLLQDGGAPYTGHVAFRGLIPMRDVPPASRATDVQAWLGPHMHAVSYPVRGGEALNVVCVVEARGAQALLDWDQAADAAALYAAAGSVCAELRSLFDAVPSFRLWALHDRPPLSGPDGMNQGCIVLLGDAAHPMRPYLAQGAAMAIEDARELQRVLDVCDGAVLDVPTVLRRYALNRWERCARVQRRARRNGRIFHATGLVRLGRDVAMRVLGERLLDQPWLYGR